MTLSLWFRVACGLTALIWAIMWVNGTLDWDWAWSSFIAAVVVIAGINKFMIERDFS